MKKYVLIIAEKPDAARRIASALDFDQKARSMNDKGVPYYVATRERKIVVVPALGHLYTVSAEAGGRDAFPVLGFRWVPRYLAEKKAQRTRAWLQVITELSRDADEFIDACDYDTEGSIIGYFILKYACGGKEGVSRRMKYSTLTKEELQRSYAQSLPHLDFPLIEAGRTRHEVDWLYGINLSRALTQISKNHSGKYRTLSTGRVQGPLLSFLASREKSIRSFTPTPYWQIHAHVRMNGKPCVAQYAKRRIETRKEAETVSNACRGIGRVEKVESKQFHQFPPPPFDLGALQVEAHGLFGYSPKTTLDLAQRLYLDALISYPRTGSQKLPSAIGYRSILRNLNKAQEYRTLTAELLAGPILKPHEGRKEDPAHPAIYPTGKLSDRVLSRPERNIWDIVVRRFMAAFGESATIRSLKVTVEVKGHLFYIEGRRTLKEGWQRFYEPYIVSESRDVPSVQEGDTVEFKETVAERKLTHPPPRYNPASLLQKMDEVGIGTESTRADIIQALYRRKYVRGERMTVTDLGSAVLEVLKDSCRKIVSTKMTKELEDRINGIRLAVESRENVLAHAVENLTPALRRLQERRREIGENLSNAIRRMVLEERIVGACPVCKTGNLVVIYSKKSGKRFAGCTNYFEGRCKASFALPQNGTIGRSRRNCRECGWPTVQVKMRRRKTWVLCFNPDCPSRKRKTEEKELSNVQETSS